MIPSLDGEAEGETDGSFTGVALPSTVGVGASLEGGAVGESDGGFAGTAVPMTVGVGAALGSDEG